MRGEFFLDASAWYPLLNRRNTSHDMVAEGFRRLVEARRPAVTTTLVVAETHALLASRVSQAAGERFLRELTRGVSLIVRVTPDLERVALEDWIARYRDQSFSLADAVSFAVMAERRITEAFALDRHFRVAGFATLPGSAS